MKTFVYRAVDADGNIVEAEHKAADKESMLEFLRCSELTPLSVEEKGASPGPSRPAIPEIDTTGKLGGGKPFTGRVNRKTTTIFTRQLATTLHAGLPLLRTIHLLHRETSNQKMRAVLGSLGKRLQKGANLSTALSDFPQIFDMMYVNMIMVGEKSADLPHAAQRLAHLMEKEQALRRKLRSALAYPLFILIFTTIITYVLTAFLIPVFSPIFLASGLDLERDYPLTKFLIDASVFCRDPYGMGVLVGLGLLGLAALRVVTSLPSGRLLVDNLKLSLPFLGESLKEVTAARFARSFSTLLQAGVPLVEALSLVAGAAGNTMVAKRIRGIGKSIQGGESLSTTLKNANLFPDLLIQMTAIGEEAGSLPDMLERVADYYDDELEANVATMTSVLEPAMIIVIGAIVGVFVMGILLPILGISTGMENQL